MASLDTREFLFNCLETGYSTMYGQALHRSEPVYAQEILSGTQPSVQFLNGKELCFHLEHNGERWPGRISLE